MPAIRDPIHNWIYCSQSEQAVIDTPLFQRLNWVSQLTLVKSLYPGGTHTRFSHSLGAMKVAGDYMKNIFRKLSEKAASGDLKALEILPNKNHQKHLTKIARFCGLLHDIGHGPFSHAFDRAIYSQIYDAEDGGHDLHRSKILQHESMESALKLGGVRAVELLAVWDKEHPEFVSSSPVQQDWYLIIKAVVGGPLGADRIDFTMRDSYFTGTQHAGTIARDRILYHVGVVVGDDSRLKLSYREKVMGDMIQALSGRQWMYANVYLHKTSSATHILVEKMLSAADKVLKLSSRVWDLEKFTYLNENTLMGEIMTYDVESLDPESEDYALIKEAIRLCKAVFARKYPKMLCERRYHEIADYLHENPFATYLAAPDKYEVIKTRFIAGVSPHKFDHYGIVFDPTRKDDDHDDHDNQPYLSCQEVLDRMGYVPAQKPYFLVRVYALQ